ncbi:MAG: hypothetical protein VKJ02_11000 [Snowella sp.]|nr:hypothetical protein [Snowella sp.]
MSPLLRSLILTTLFSFTTPIFFVGGLLFSLWLLGNLPFIAFIGQIGASHLVRFLSIFGNGYPITGLFIIGGACSLVGGVFDVFNFCFYQNARVRN